MNREAKIWEELGRRQISKYNYETVKQFLKRVFPIKQLFLALTLLVKLTHRNLSLKAQVRMKTPGWDWETAQWECAHLASKIKQPRSNP